MESLPTVTAADMAMVQMCGCDPEAVGTVIGVLCLILLFEALLIILMITKDKKGA